MPTINCTSVRSHATGRRFFGAVAALLLACVIAPAVHAQQEWAVHDSDANSTLSDIKGNTKGTNTDTTALKTAIGDTNAGGGNTVNANLDAINKKLIIGNSENNQPYKDSQPGARVVDPDEVLPASTSTALDDGAGCKAVADAQQATCNKIVAIQNAKYKYMLLMYETNKKRDDMLRELLIERSKITASDANQYGKLEDNTNKLTALYNLISLDQQQMATVNYAYDANIEYLRKAQALMARGANTGKKADSWTNISLPTGDTIDLGPAISGLISGAALQAALQSVKSTAPSGMQRLSIGDSNGL
ncbi:hypothetical protein J2X57_003368 [Luteibacter sp. 1214]|uniref:hypothetical protein n=1 Tax=Luteibacter sp. 1214 TaxID=2817735 RepID=UPI00285B6B29|nr:hypothetical protein [Luteibacter sp. 1214]MDR6644130.1 hypothetical protein [Luteibacter sp. 1214]